jgi:hypothetical protein
MSYYEPTLEDISMEALREYAFRRMLRDQCIRNPRGLAMDLRFYQTNYQRWWEQRRRS